MDKPVYIRGSGTYLPGNPVPFEQIDEVLGELKEAPLKIQKWMKETALILSEILHMKVYYYAIDPSTGKFTDDNITMSVKASLKAIEHAGLIPEDIDLICYGSAHQDQMPTASARIQEKLGIEQCEEISIHSNCTSAYKALHVAVQLIKNGRNNNALVVSSNIASSELRADYYNQSIVDKDSLFLRWFLCDGAGAIVISSEPANIPKQKNAGNYLIEFTYIESIGGKRPSLMYNLRPAYWMNPREEYEKGLHHLRQKFRNALSTPIFWEKDGSVFVSGLKRMLEKAKIPTEKIKLLQINLPARHIAESVIDECERIGIPRSCVDSRLEELGYCGPPMAFISLDKTIREAKFQNGDYILSFVTEVSKFMQAGFVVRYED